MGGFGFIKCIHLILCVPISTYRCLHVTSLQMLFSANRQKPLNTCKPRVVYKPLHCFAAIRLDIQRAIRLFIFENTTPFNIRYTGSFIALNVQKCYSIIQNVFMPLV